MSTLSLRLPKSLHRHAKEVAERDGISMNQFISTAVAEKLSALETESYLVARAERGSVERYQQILAKVPAVQPDPGDEI